MAWLLSSRRNIALAAAGLLLVLDLGRSIYARLAYSQPYEVWDGAPYDLQLNVWPPASNVPAGASLGQKVYVENCAVCHGTTGDGKGVSAPSMSPRPLDFTRGIYKYKTTHLGQPPSDADLINTVTNGLHASAMPYFSDVLTEDEIAAVVEYIKGFSPLFDNAHTDPLPIPPRVPADAASIQRGAELFRVNCSTCHGANGRARAELKDSNGFNVYARDLTAPWTFRGGSKPEQIFTRLTLGLAPSPMPSFSDSLTEEQRWDVVNYIESIARIPPWETGGELDGPGFAENPVQRGQYIVHAEICGLCHTQIGPFGIYRGDTHYLAGGMLIQGYPQGFFVSRNLTADPETGVGSKSAEELASIIRTGRASDRSLSLYGMPWMVLHNLTEDDTLAIAQYLKTLPPVKNAAPPKLEYGFIETVVMKIAYGLPAASPAALTYAQSSYANPNPGAIPADWPRRILIAAQWVTLIGGVIIFGVAAPKGRRLPTGTRGWLLTLASLFGVVLVSLTAWVIYDLPDLAPPEMIAEQFNAGLHDPQLSEFDTPEDYELAQRGKYLFTTISCSYCHGNDGSGGLKFNWQNVGTLWARNISPDVETGIGSWTNAQIARAIRSGLAADGRPLYWQGMPWDHFSNLDEEDVQALVAYLRSLPPVSHAVPLPAPPRADDCEVYTIYLVPDNFEPGCK